MEVLQDMLQLLKDQVSSSHSEWLEIIVIVLIVLEIILGVATSECTGCLLLNEGLLTSHSSSTVLVDLLFA